MAEFKTIEAFTEDEVQGILRLIEGGQGGHLSQSRYHAAVYEQFFRAKQWRWPWYEYWDAKFKEFGAYPSDWPNCDLPDTNPSYSKIVCLLKVQELKEGLVDAGVNFPSSAKKKELQELATSTDEVTERIALSAVGRACAHRYAQNQGYGLYEILMRTLIFRANSEFNDGRTLASGMKTKILTIGPEFEPFVNFALSENPASRCPLYPGDRTLRIASRE